MESSETGRANFKKIYLRSMNEIFLIFLEGAGSETAFQLIQGRGMELNYKYKVSVTC